MEKKLLNKNFIILVIGQIVSVLGSAVLRFAIDLHVLDVSGRADVFATVLALSLIPYVIFAPLGGVIADRFNRRNLMVVLDFLNGAVVAVLILLFLMNQASLVAITIVLIFLSLISAVYQPTVQASVPTLVNEESLASANGLVSALNSLSNLCAPVLGGVLYGLLGIDVLLTISSIVFILAAVMEIFIKMPFIKPEGSGSLLQIVKADLKQGFSYMVHENSLILKTCVLATFLNLILSAFLIVGTPYILRMVMHSNNGMYSFGMMLAEVGTILGALAAGKFTQKMTIKGLYKWLFMIAGALLPMALSVTSGVLHLGYLPSFVLYFVFAVFIMSVATIITIFVITKIQTETPNELLGKIMSIVLAAASCALPLGQMFYGVLLEKFKSSIFLPILLVAALTAILALFGKAVLADADRKQLRQPSELASEKSIK
ncbi:MAG: MFS transporter [Streptococcaceae bacterium]|jgi:MFS family permease|nr:MFS transporter [Streptococcaceae bacterium]